MTRISINYTLRSKKLLSKEWHTWRNTINNARSKAKKQERQRTNWKIKRLKDTKSNVKKRPLRKHWLSWMKRIWMNKVWITDSIIDSSSSNGDLRNKKKECKCFKKKLHIWQIACNSVLSINKKVLFKLKMNTTSFNKNSTKSKVKIQWNLMNSKTSMKKTKKSRLQNTKIELKSLTENSQILTKEEPSSKTSSKTSTIHLMLNWSCTLLISLSTIKTLKLSLDRFRIFLKVWNQTTITKHSS